MQYTYTTSLDILSLSETLFSCGLDSHAQDMRLTELGAAAIAPSIADCARTNLGPDLSRPFGASLDYKRTRQA